MIAFLLKRALVAVAVLIGVVLVIFFLFMVIPADPARLTLGQRADVSSLENIRKEFGLDKPKGQQLLLYLQDLSPIAILSLTQENAGKYHYHKIFNLSNSKAFVVKKPYLRRSYQTHAEVGEILAKALPDTVVLALSAFIFAAVFGIIFGVIAAVYRNSKVETIVMIVANLGISLPSFFAAILIAWIFGYLLSGYTGLNMFGSLYDVDPFTGRYMKLENLVLPAIALGIRPLAIFTQLTRSSMLDVLQQDYMRTATAKGLAAKTVIFRHGLPNALNPVITAVSGWLASLMAGAFFIEYIFGWQGLGRVTVEALQTADLPVVMGAVLYIALIFIVINIFVDIIYGIIDPRIRTS